MFNNQTIVVFIVTSIIVKFFIELDKSLCSLLKAETLYLPKK